MGLQPGELISGGAYNRNFTVLQACTKGMSQVTSFNKINIRRVCTKPQNDKQSLLAVNSFLSSLLAVSFLSGLLAVSLYFLVRAVLYIFVLFLVLYIEYCPNQQLKAICKQTGVNANHKQTGVKANRKQVNLRPDKPAGLSLAKFYYKYKM